MRAREVAGLAGMRLVDRAAMWMVVALGFSLPLSTALDNLIVAALVLLLLAGGRVRERVETVRRNPVLAVPLALLAVHLAGAFYTQGNRHDVLHAVDKASVFLLIPVLIALKPDRVWRERALLAFAAALVLTLVLSYMVWFGVLAEGGWVKGVAADPVVFKLHITHSVLMAFGAFLFALKARDAPAWRIRSLWWLASGLAAFNVLFMVHGRTGQLILLTLLVFALLHWYRWRGLIAVALAGALLGALVQFMPSSSLIYRAKDTIAELEDWRAGKPAQPSNMRPEVWRNSLEIVRAHPIAGVGTGGFAAAYEARVTGGPMKPASHPENQYLLFAVQFGLAGLAVLLAAFVLQWRLSRHLDDRALAVLAKGVLIMVAVGSMFISFLHDHTEVLLFAWLTGLLYAGLPPAASRG